MEMKVPSGAGTTLLVNTTSGVHFIYPKVKDRVVIEEDEKWSCHKKGACINPNGDNLYGNV